MSVSGGSYSATATAPPHPPPSSLKRKRPPNIEIPIVLREVTPDELSLRESTPRKSDSACFGTAGVGVFSVKGKKKFMEDTNRIIPSFLGNPSRGFFGVYDGHGGRKAADFVSERLHENIIEMIENSGSDSSKEEAVKAGYLKTDKEFLEQGLSSGACCVTVLIEEQDIIVSNLGDCRAVLSRGGVAEALTNDHRADLVIERQRIEDNGGFVEMHRGAWRVHGILAVSRSIGDAHLKQWVMAEPETTVLQLTPDMEFLVLASDGLWEEVGNQEAVDIISHLCTTWKKPPKLTHLYKDNDDENSYGRVNVSPSSKLRRVALVKQKKRSNQHSPSHQRSFKIKNEDNEENDYYSHDTDSPPSKLRRVSLMKRINPKPGDSNQENNNLHNAGFSSGGLVAACKELANLAVSRGSLDDITVMIIDLNCFRRTNGSSLDNVASD